MIDPAAVRDKRQIIYVLEGTFDELIHAGVEQRSNPRLRRFTRHRDGLPRYLDINDLPLFTENVDVESRLAPAANSQASGL